MVDFNRPGFAGLWGGFFCTFLSYLISYFKATALPDLGEICRWPASAFDAIVNQVDRTVEVSQNYSPNELRQPQSLLVCDLAQAGVKVSGHNDG